MIPPRVHHAARRRGGGVAARGARAAAGDAGDRVSHIGIAGRRPRTAVAAFHQGLKRAGYVEGENVAIEYRWAENQDRSTAGAGGRFGSPAGRRDRHAWRHPSRHLAAKAATTTIPSSSASREDPVRLGLVASLARPGGNLTGINFFNG